MGLGVSCERAPVSPSGMPQQLSSMCNVRSPFQPSRVEPDEWDHYIYQSASLDAAHTGGIMLISNFPVLHIQACLWVCERRARVKDLT